MPFADLGIPPRVIAALHERGIDTPFPIQAATLPDSLAGRDVLGRGRTGSGKTVAFALPTIATLANSGRRRAPHTPRALVLVPTRELAIQVAETMTPLAAASATAITSRDRTRAERSTGAAGRAASIATVSMPRSRSAAMTRAGMPRSAKGTGAWCVDKGELSSAVGSGRRC